MFWELYQTSVMYRAQQQASDAAASSRRSERQAKTLHDDVRQLTARVDSLTIGCQALWELLSEHTDVTAADLQARIREIDLRDGVEDGRITPQVGVCEACDRPLNPRRPHCMYCGQEIRNEAPFG